MTTLRHRLGDCPNGVEWCDPQDHLCEDCTADMVDRTYERYRDYDFNQGEDSQTTHE